MTLLELIEAYASATAEARTAENLGDIEHREREAFTLHAEIKRRWITAQGYAHQSFAGSASGLIIDILDGRG